MEIVKFPYRLKSQWEAQKKWEKTNQCLKYTPSKHNESLSYLKGVQLLYFQVGLFIKDEIAKNA